MAEKEFFRAEYREGDDGVIIPTVWIGVQGFDLTESYGNSEETAQEESERFVAMFKKAIDNYAEYKMKPTKR